MLDVPAEPNSMWSGDNPDSGSSAAPWRVYNIGNNSPVELLDYINAIEEALNIKADKELLPLQPGDVPETYANVDDLVKGVSYFLHNSFHNKTREYIETNYSKSVMSNKIIQMYKGLIQN